MYPKNARDKCEANGQLNFQVKSIWFLSLKTNILIIIFDGVFARFINIKSNYIHVLLVLIIKLPFRQQKEKPPLCPIFFQTLLKLTFTAGISIILEASNSSFNLMVLP